MKKVDYSETIAAFDLKLIDLMKICEYRRPRPFLDLGPMSFIDDAIPIILNGSYEFKFLFSEITGQFSTKF